MPSYNNQCDITFNPDKRCFYLLQITTAESAISHFSTDLTLKFTTTLDEPYENESFSFRNV